MKLLFTGASSFTGMWFVKTLAKSGHEILAIFPRKYNDYMGLRKQRVDEVRQYTTQVFEAPFGSEAFVDAINDNGSVDLLCHHAADVSDYKSPTFNPCRALERNTCNLDSVLSALESKGCHQVLLTGSIFEQGEGEGDDELRSFSPYGLSKKLTSDFFHYHCMIRGMTLGKFVIPNPFGPYEEPRYTDYLMRSWYSGKTPAVKYPNYIRDNIHVSLLSLAYCAFAESLKLKSGFQVIHPSGYRESQGDFTHRFAREISTRLSISCPFVTVEQTEFPEPRVRINKDLYAGQWDEQESWDSLAAYYEKIYDKQ